MAPVYADAADFEAYVPGWTTNVQVDLEAILEQAERDIDSIIPGYIPQANGLKFGDPHGANELALRSYQVDALTRAVCAQAEYRIAMGPDFFVMPQYDSVTGPDFATVGRAPMIAPKVWRELRGFGLVLHPLMVI